MAVVRVRAPPKESLAARARTCTARRGRVLFELGGQQVLNMAVEAERVAAVFGMQPSNALIARIGATGRNRGIICPVIEFKRARISRSAGIFVGLPKEVAQRVPALSELATAVRVVVAADRAIHDIAGEFIVATAWLSVSFALDVDWTEVGFRIGHVFEPKAGAVCGIHIVRIVRRNRGIGNCAIGDGVEPALAKNWWRGIVATVPVRRSQKVAIVICVHAEGRAHLLQIAGANDTDGLGFGIGKGGKQQRRQNGDNRYNYQQLNQRKCQARADARFFSIHVVNQGYG